MEIPKSAMKLLLDDDFVDKRIHEQLEYLNDLNVRFKYSRGIAWGRYIELKVSAEERLNFFESLKEYKMNNKS